MKVEVMMGNNKKNKMYLWLAVIIVSIIVIIVGVVMAMNNGKDKAKDGDKNKDKPEQKEEYVLNEDKIEEQYGFTKEEAIAIIKNIFNGDGYEFTAKIRIDNMYVVTVTNKDIDSKYVYIVNPNDGSFVRG